MNLPILLNESSHIPLYTQAASQVKDLIINGDLKAGSKLPSTRELSDLLSISRSTASKAYEELLRQGFIKTKTASGTFVSTDLPSEQSLDLCRKSAGSAIHNQEAKELSRFAKHLLDSDGLEAPDLELHPELNYSAPLFEDLPWSKWQELIAKSHRARNSYTYSHDSFGNLCLRKSLAEYLFRSRGIRTSLKQIAIFSNSQQALDLISRLLLDPGDCAIVEEPGFPGARRLFALHSIRTHPCHVSPFGLSLDDFERAPEDTRIAYLSSKNDPLGISMPSQRMSQLLQIAKRRKLILIEDAFDCELRYGEKREQSFYELDESDSVIYLASFWKLLYPLTKLAFAIIPETLLAVFQKAKAVLQRDCFHPEELALAEFIESGQLEKQIRRLRASYSRRRAILLRELLSTLKDQVKVKSASSGMHIIAVFPGISQDKILSSACKSSFPVVSTSTYYLNNNENENAEFIIPFSVMCEDEIKERVQNFACELAGLAV